MENLVHAKELHHIADKAELIADVHYNLPVQCVQNAKRNCRSDQSDYNTFDHKRCAHKIIRRSDQLHDRNLFLADGDTDRDRIADQKDGNTEQDQDDARRDVPDQTVKVGQRVGHLLGLLYFTHSIDGLQVGNQRVLHRYIIHVDGIARGICQRVIAGKTCSRRFISLKVNFLEAFPCFIC